MAKADKSDTSTEEEKAVEAKISDDVVDAEIIEETSEDTEAPAEEDLKTDDQADETEATEEEVPQEETSEAADDLVASDDGYSEETEDSSEEETATSEETPVEAPVQPTQPTAAPVKKTGFLPVALGGVVAAALGFGLSQYVGPLSAEKDPALVALETLVAEQSQKIDELLAGQADAQTAIEAAQSSASSATSNVEGLTGAVAAVNSRIDDAAGALATLDGRLAALEKNPISQNLPSAALEAYEREVEELKAAVAQQRAEAASMEENAKLTAQQALARAALSRVLSALDSGTPYRVALTDFSAATGTAVSAALETYADDGVTSLASLQDSFPEVARKALAAARSGEQTGGVKLTDFFKAQLGARSVTPQEGDGADAVLSRAEGALRAGRVTDALAELSNLPEEAKPAFVDWIAQADARQAAFAAGEALSQQLNTN
ncbi:COG4223 family protein [Cognatishimia activa]|uniref:COG4223 family protein n=1 Tax=Cognatishimia activa TaxID=1715691 RepID=UPI00222F6D17|nr:hypothetical protein [Cognatishimia activa]UZD90753.1 hypothetical protein M0D42_14350 [Cognatishimia activa]